MHGLKYIRLDTFFGGHDVIITFPRHVDHGHMAAILATPKENIVSAGFVRMTVDRDHEPSLKCTGESISLDKSSLPEDTQILNRQLRL